MQTERGATTLNEEGNPDYLSPSEKIADDALAVKLNKEADRLGNLVTDAGKQVENATNGTQSIVQGQETTTDNKIAPIDPKLLKFETAHAMVTLEQELLHLSPIERYYDLLERMEKANYENDTEVQMVIATELHKIDPKDFNHESWVEFYTNLYNKKEKQQKNKGCNFLVEEEEDYQRRAAIAQMAGNQSDEKEAFEHLNAVQRVRREINKEREKKGEEPCTNVITPLNTHKKMASWDEDDYGDQLESIRQGLGGVDESKGDNERRCDNGNIAYNNHKRLFYLKMTMDNKEYEKLTNPQKKAKLAELKTRVLGILGKKGLSDKDKKNELKKLGWEIKLTDKLPFKKNFQRMYKEKPSLEDFKKTDDVIADKCPNIFELSNFTPDDKSEMGGHPGAFINIYMPATTKGGNDCEIWGGKKWVKDSRTEYNFYEYLYKNQDNEIFKTFKEYIPLFKDDLGRCLPYQPNSTEKAKKYMHYYIPMNNIHNSVREGTEDVNNLDIKLGFRTSFIHEKGFDGNKSGIKRDTEQSISSKVGFRLEGTSLKNRINEISNTEALESGWHETSAAGEIKRFLMKFKPVIGKEKKTSEEEEAKRLKDVYDKDKKFVKNIRDIEYIKKKYKLDQYKLYILNPGFIYDTFFYNTPDKYINDFELKLIGFEKNFIKKNFEAFETENSPAIAFIGCSIFIVSGSKGINFKFMDFAHPYVLSWENNNGVKELSKKGQVCCPTIMKTGEPFEGTNSYNNKLGYKDNYKNKGVKLPGGKEIFKDDPDDVKFKKNITYDEWSHVFQNFMASLISFVYSFRLWVNSRKNYSAPNAKKKKDGKLFESYRAYNNHFDKEDSREVALKQKKKNKDPYFWTQDKKIPMWHNIKNKSQSNLTRIPV